MKVSTFLFILLFASFLASGYASANGGNIRIAEGKYIVNISSSPVTPVSGEKVEMLISFADVQKNELLPQDLRVWIEIRLKSTEEIIFPEQEFRAERGILDFDFTYPKTVLHEFFVRFEKPDEPGKIYETEDFLVDVQPPRASDTSEAGDRNPLFIGLFGFFIGLIFGFALYVKENPSPRLGMKT